MLQELTKVRREIFEEENTIVYDSRNYFTKVEIWFKGKQIGGKTDATYKYPVVTVITKLTQDEKNKKLLCDTCTNISKKRKNNGNEDHAHTIYYEESWKDYREESINLNRKTFRIPENTDELSRIKKKLYGQGRAYYIGCTDFYVLDHGIIEIHDFFCDILGKFKDIKVYVEISPEFTHKQPK